VWEVAEEDHEPNAGHGAGDASRGGFPVAHGEHAVRQSHTIETASGLRHGLRLGLRRELQALFDLYDLQHEGFISLTQMREALVGCGLDLGEANSLLSKHDLKRDSYLISPEVFEAVMLATRIWN